MAQGGEIDQHLSLRGRTALADLEAGVHRMLKDCVVAAPKIDDGNCIAVVIKYHVSQPEPFHSVSRSMAAYHSDTHVLLN